MILMKMADISNECRPMEVAERWLERLFQEYFTQVFTGLYDLVTRFPRKVQQALHK